MRRALDAGVDARDISRRLGRWRTGRPQPIAGHRLVRISGPAARHHRVRGTHRGDGRAPDAPRASAPEADRLPGLLAAHGIARCAFVGWEATHDELRLAAQATGYLDRSRLDRGPPAQPARSRSPRAMSSTCDSGRRACPSSRGSASVTRPAFVESCRQGWTAWSSAAPASARSATVAPTDCDASSMSSLGPPRHPGGCDGPRGGPRVRHRHDIGQGRSAVAGR